MFDYFRRNTKKFQPILWVVILAFVAFYGVLDNDKGDTRPVAKVNGTSILYGQYRNELMQTENQIRSILKDNVDEYLARINIKEMVINRLIESELIRQVSGEMGIKISDYDLIEKLKTFDVFKNESGELDKKQIISILNRNRIDPKDFIEGQRQEVGINVVRKIIEDCNVVSNEELWQRYVEENEKAEADYAYFPLKSFVNDVEVPEDEIKAYFSKNADKYKVEDSADVEYTLVNIDDFASDAKVSDDEVKEYYDSNPDEFKVNEDQVKARHILFSVKPGQGTEEVEFIRKKAERVLKEAREGKDFKGLAKVYSDEPLSTSTGGDLGFFGKGEMDSEFEKAAFALEEGEISGLVKSSFGYHIIKAEKKLSAGEIKPFEYVGEDLKFRLERKKGRELALGKAEEIRANLEQGKKDEKVQTIKKTVFRNQAIERINNSGKFFNTAYALDEGKISEPLNIGQSFAVIKTIKKTTAHDGTFEEVRGRVAEDAKKEKAFGVAEKKVSEIAKAVNEGQSFSELIKKENALIKSTGSVLRREVSGDAKDGDILSALIFSLKKERPAGYTVNTNGAYIALLKNKEEVDSREFESKKSLMRSKILEERKDVVFSEVIANYRKSGKIEIAESLL